MNKVEFFKQVTERICSSLDIRIALQRTFKYMADYLPLDEMFLDIYDKNIQSIVRIAEVSHTKVLNYHKIIYFPESIWGQITEKYWTGINISIINSPDQSKYTRLIAPILGLKGNSDLVVKLHIDNATLGFLVLRAYGEGRYKKHHAKLMIEVLDPFNIAMANAMAYLKLVRLNNKIIDDNRFLQNELKVDIDDKLLDEQQGLAGVIKMLNQVAPLNNTVLLLGETGTGKEVIANKIHSLSTRSLKPFIKINCGAIPIELVDSELFGFEKGAFTGADKMQKGRFERANGGTIFLDEIGELPLQAQTRLLRFIQFKEVERVGGKYSIKLDVRIIAATNRNLQEMIQLGTFREDLWYRLNVFPILIPPLRQRIEDIALLAKHFIMKKCLEIGKDFIPIILPEVLKKLEIYDWPGNVRELENIIERELILTNQHYLNFHKFNIINNHSDNIEMEASGNPTCIDDAIKQHISKALHLTKGQVDGSKGAAKLLKIHPNTLRNKMNKLNISYGRSYA